MFGCTLSEQNPSQNVTAFAAEQGGRVKLAVFNKAPQPVTVNIRGAREAHKGEVIGSKRRPSKATRA